MCSTGSVWALPQTGCPIRKSPDHHSLPTPRRLSQVAASFIGAWCLGIHLRPLVACLTYNHSSHVEEWATDKEDPKDRRRLFDKKSRFSTYSVVNVLVEMTGLEPVTPCVQGRCSPS